MKKSELKKWLKKFIKNQKINENNYTPKCNVSYDYINKPYDYFNLYYEEKLTYEIKEQELPSDGINCLFIFIAPLLLLLPFALMFMKGF